MDLLAYWTWKNYKKDTLTDRSLHFNSNKARLHTALEPGDSLWLVGGRGKGENLEYVLLRRLYVASKGLNPEGSEYGPYRVVGDPLRTVDYDHQGPDMTDVLLQLEFLPTTSKPAKRIRVQAKKDIAMAVLAMRSLTYGDVRLLTDWAERQRTVRLPLLKQ